MKIDIRWAGRSLKTHEQEWIDTYVKRCRPHARLTITRVKEHKVEKNVATHVRRLILDPKGKFYSTEEFASFLFDANQSPKKDLRFYIGGAYGIPDEIRRSANGLVSLSPLTLPHRLALLVLTEQVYRTLSYRAREPYHHA